MNRAKEPICHACV